MTDPLDHLRQAVTHCAKLYGQRGHAPWLFDDFRWLAAEMAVDEAYAAKSSSAYSKAVSEMVGVFEGLAEGACWVVDVGVRE